MEINQSSIDNIKRCTIFAYEKFITEDIAKSINVRNFKPRFNERNQLVEDLEIDFEESLKILNYVLNNNKIEDRYSNYRNFGMLDFIEAINECYCLSVENPSEARILKNISTTLGHISTKELCEKFSIPNIHERYKNGELYYGVTYPTKNILDFLEFMLKNEENFNCGTEYDNVKKYLAVKDVYNDFKNFVKNKKVDEIMIYTPVDNAEIKVCDILVFNGVWFVADKEKLKKHKLPLPTSKNFIENLYNDVLDIETMLKIVKIANEDNDIEIYKILEDRLEILKIVNKGEN
ncbi:MAG: hypothetical protein IKC49_02830 [Clostridia bacterium]|nr:hypothetical protein [bacterium]MBR2969970.1 hypothetical protein [Clostridia bacterium]